MLVKERRQGEGRAKELPCNGGWRRAGGGRACRMGPAARPAPYGGKGQQQGQRSIVRGADEGRRPQLIVDKSLAAARRRGGAANGLPDG